MPWLLRYEPLLARPTLYGYCHVLRLVSLKRAKPSASLAPGKQETYHCLTGLHKPGKKRIIFLRYLRPAELLDARHQAQMLRYLLCPFPEGLSWTTCLDSAHSLTSMKTYILCSHITSRGRDKLPPKRRSGVSYGEHFSRFLHPSG